MKYSQLSKQPPLVHEKLVAYERWSLTGTINEQAIYKVVTYGRWSLTRSGCLEKVDRIATIFRHGIFLLCKQLKERIKIVKLAIGLVTGRKKANEL